jgi:DNA-directed RNA polymerase subunit RPC12/RpoP
MDQKVYHGSISPYDFAQSIAAAFNRGNYQVQQLNYNNQVVIQIATTGHSRSGGQTALTITLRPIEDGVIVELGEQQWLGIAASLGMSALSALTNPMNLLFRLGDIAQDIESLQLTDEVWKVIDQTAYSLGSSFALSERLRRIECAYCGTANPVGQSGCVACGAPLGDTHPVTCPRCGYVVAPGYSRCPNCNLILIKS